MSALIVFRINFFEKLFQENHWMMECQTIWIQIRPDILSGLICVKTVCKGYQQTTLVDKSFRIPDEVDA